MCPMKNIQIVAYDPTWQAAFEQEAARLAGIFGEDLVAIHHIGSTAVPGLHAKPVIDILPVVHDISRVDLLNQVMQVAGYAPWGEHGIAGRRLFTKGGEEHRTHNVHVFQVGSPDIARHLDFRDYLRTYPEVAKEYAQLKIPLARQFPNDVTAYNLGKDAFIKEIQRRAREWRAA
jgi:GrpB-like predicted nucleotidyltransferase (UPF0157 family)